MKKITSVIMFFLIALFINVNVVKAEENVEIKSVDMIEKSNSVFAEITSINDLNLNIKAKMYNIDDYFKYKIVLKNNSGEDLKMSSITDNNELEYISNTYHNNKEDFKSGEEIEIIVTTKYIKQIEKYKDNFTNNFIININYKNGKSTSISVDNMDNPNTIDNVNIYIFIALISILLLILFVIKSKKLKYMLFIISLFISVSSIMAADLTKVNNNINLELYGPKKKLVDEI